MIKFLLASIPILFLLLSGCARYSLQPEIERLIAQTTTRLDNNLINDNVTWLDNDLDKKQKTTFTQALESGLSITQAMSASLLLNSTLQSQFDELGIAKTDLAAAGLFSNPHIGTVFRFPNNKKDKACIEIDASLQLSDLWQIPLRKKVAQKTLELTTLATLRTIIDIRTETKKFYLSCLYEQAILDIIKETSSYINQLEEQIRFRQSFGYTSDYDLAFATVTSATWQQKVIEQESMVKQAHVCLRNAIGTKISSDKLPLTMHFSSAIIPLPELEDILTYTLQQSPQILIAQLRIHQAQKQLSLEKAKLCNNVNLGIAYERHSDKSHSIGPSLSFDLPLFNTNSPQIKHASKRIIQAKHNFSTVVQDTKTALYKKYVSLRAKRDQIQIFETQIIPASKQAIAYAQEHMDTMQLTMITFLESLVALFKQKKLLVENQYQYALTLLELERVIGCDLEKIETL